MSVSNFGVPSIYFFCTVESKRHDLTCAKNDEKILIFPRLSEEKMNDIATATLDDAILQHLSAGRKSARELNHVDAGLRHLADPLRKASVWHGGHLPAIDVIRERLGVLRSAGLVWYDGYGWQLMNASAEGAAPVESLPRSELTGLCSDTA